MRGSTKRLPEKSSSSRTEAPRTADNAIRSNPASRKAARAMESNAMQRPRIDEKIDVSGPTKRSMLRSSAPGIEPITPLTMGASTKTIPWGLNLAQAVRRM